MGGMPLPADVDGLLSQALLLGELGPAVELCLKEERFADAIILAHAGGADLLKRTQERYLAKEKTRISSVIAHGVGKEGRGLLGPCLVDAHPWGLVFRGSASLFLPTLTTPTSPRAPVSGLTGSLLMSGFSSTFWCVTPTACGGWIVDGLLPSLPITAASLCCEEELEGYGVCL